MKPRINQEERAFVAWTNLVNCARERRLITYIDLANAIGVHHRAIRFVLGVIQEFCLESGLPPLTILIVNKNTGLPGDGFIAYDVNNVADGINKVYTFDWTAIQNPFGYAEGNTNSNQLVDAIVNSPENSGEIYARVKVRGIAQRIFRQALLRAYNYKCAICGLSYIEALQGCHIISYSESNQSQRLDIRNGLLLCANHHKLFDSGYILINDDYSIDIYDSNQEDGEYTKYDGLTGVSFHKKKIMLPNEIKHYPSIDYLRQIRS